jgi:hypothetical protein
MFRIHWSFPICLWQIVRRSLARDAFPGGAWERVNHTLFSTTGVASMNQPTRARLFERRPEVANDVIPGWTQTYAQAGCRFVYRQGYPTDRQVAASFDDRATLRTPHPRPLSRDLAAIREFWREFSVFDFRSVLERAQGFVGCAQRHGVVAPKGAVVAPKYRFCATAGLEREFCVSHSCVRRSIDFRTIASDRKKLAESRKCGDASAGLDRGSGEHRSLKVKSQSFEKLRMCAMRGC